MTRDMKCEAMKRLKILQKQGLDGTVLPHYDKLDEVFFSDHRARGTAVHAPAAQFAQLQRAIDEVETLYGVHVYYVALCHQGPLPHCHNAVCGGGPRPVGALPPPLGRGAALGLWL